MPHTAPAAALLLAAAVLSGCAPKPEKVRATYVPAEPLQGHSCAALSEQEALLAQQLETLSESQRRTRRADAWGVALLGLPMGRMSGGNRAKDIAQVKGELAAVQASKAGRC